MNSYDFQIRQQGTGTGEWSGFALAWKGLAGIQGFPARPYRRWLPWQPDPGNPGDPSLGGWGRWRWSMDVALIDGLVGLLGAPPEDRRSAQQMRDDLLLFQTYPALELTDLDGSTHNVRMTGYTEHAIEPFDASHPNGGMLAQVEFTRTD